MDEIVIELNLEFVIRYKFTCNSSDLSLSSISNILLTLKNPSCFICNISLALCNLPFISSVLSFFKKVYSLHKIIGMMIPARVTLFFTKLSIATLMFLTCGSCSKYSLNNNGVSSISFSSSQLSIYIKK